MASRGSSPVARLLALVAVIASVLALGIVVATSLGGDDDGDSDTGATGAAACDPKADDAVELGSYIIKPDENFELIAARTCTDADELTELNPNIDPFALQAGSCVNLEPKGCKNREQ